MRSILLLLLSAGTLAAQPIGVGIKGGLPLNDFLNAARNQNFQFDTTTNRYIIGPTVDLRLPFGLGVEFDVLYRHFGYNWFSSGGTTPAFNASASGSAWEFPLVGKYRFKGIPLVRPYVEAGVAWNHLSDVSSSVASVINGVTGNATTSVSKQTTTGFVIGGGLDIKALIIHITPEIRYIRWSNQQITSPGGLLTSNQNQGEFLIGITF